MKDQFNSIIKSEELKDITLDMVEKVIDSQITDEVLKEVPIIKSIIAVRKTYNSISDGLFIKKAMKVLLQLGEVNWNERIEFIDDLDSDSSSGSEKILMAIDRLETLEKCEVFGVLCKLRAQGKIENKSDFLRLTKLIQDAYRDDLFLLDFFDGKDEAEKYYSLVNLGLIYRDETKRTNILGGKAYSSTSPVTGVNKYPYHLTYLGVLFRKHFKSLMVNKFL